MKDFMKDLKQNKISKVVGYNDEILLRVSLEIQTNHVKMKTFKIAPNSIEDFIKDMNNIDFIDKLKAIKKEYSYITDWSEDLLREVYIKYIKKQYDTFKKTAEFRESIELFSNLDNYDGDSMPIVKWLSTFSNEILDKSVMEFVPAIVSKIDSIPKDIISNIYYSNNNSNINEFVVYMGNKRKYRGSIGYIEKFRDDEASTLVNFPQKRNNKESLGKLWCSNENLLTII